ncbi:hypothetical protein BAU08_03845 [Bordetella bronchialis]|uniref:SHSP domain-containing protein n=2 Tax=Bordetella bronchialis TaxID=463025 RepID=A0A193FTC5_9BORD|nr:hypothetical protein BAU06_03880 [Bordetella bronchialis]ANN70578.1 hypothetical protein BAU08_03845 [Bordetella bronchialis]
MGAMPQMEVCEEGAELCVSVELPGVRQEDLDVRLMGDTLVISGEKKSSNAQREGGMHVSERSYGRFQRQVTLPFTPDPERTQAALENGVLTVRLGRMPENAGSRRIEVRGAGQGAGQSAVPMQGQGAATPAGGAGAASAAGSTGSAGSEDGGQTPP